MDTRYDAIVIGTGQAGPSLAVKLAKSGRKTAIIERKLFGGTCVNVGCIPTKTLIASARAAHIARHAADYGVQIDGSVRVDMQKVKARKDAVVRDSNQGVASWLKNTPNLTVIEGHARFIGPYALSVDAAHTQFQMHASEIFINVGGRALVPDIPGLAEIDYLTNSSMMDVDFLPPHLLIIGGSYIGLEFAQMYRRFGSQVSVFENGSRLISREDPEVSAAVQAILEKEGIAVHCNAKNLQLRKNGKDVVLSYAADGAAVRKEISGSHMLLAVGRVPNTQDLGLDKAGIATDARGFITVDDQLHTNVTGIWAMGDVNGRGAFTHTSYNDYEIVAANLLEQEERKVTDRIPAYALFIDPPLARVGMNEQEARATGRKILKAKMMMTRVGRAKERGETQGFMSVLVDAASKKILGASLLGIESDEAIHCIMDVMYAGAPYTTITHAMHIHPTVSELIPTMLGDLKPLE
ncbi:FAD-containing oxidoreductase [Undibacterium terreum]|uniref:Mercuric reductase n=1 Tax=Undibacterium terreum TaxID=1224302 RepID=A0A916XF76_9BURK|nr:FAD-containing oxidoreductase [Undibacterium terreum]GGC67687.1 mercuric reductase [Undibacterium terreum]